MKFFKPIEIEKSTTYNNITYKQSFYTSILNTDIEDENYSNWDSSTSYNVDEYVIVPELKTIYKSSADNNIDNYPPATPTKWTKWGYVNSYKMFGTDEFIGDRTTGENNYIEVDFSQLDSFALIDTRFIQLKVELIDADTEEVIYIEDINGQDCGAIDFAEYFYKPIEYNKKIFKNNLEWLPNSKLKLTFTGAFEIGAFVAGIIQDMGCTLMGTSVTIESSSAVEKDEFTGFRKILRYGSVKRLNVKIFFDSVSYFNNTIQDAEDLVDRNIVFIPTELDKFSEMITLGYFTELEVPIENNVNFETHTEIIGVI